MSGRRPHRTVAAGLLPRIACRAGRGRDHLHDRVELVAGGEAPAARRNRPTGLRDVSYSAPRQPATARPDRPSQTATGHPQVATAWSACCPRHSGRRGGAISHAAGHSTVRSAR